MKQDIWSEWGTKNKEPKYDEATQEKSLRDLQQTNMVTSEIKEHKKEILKNKLFIQLCFCEQKWPLRFLKQK